MINIEDCLINDDGENLIFEWFNHPKKLTIYLNKDEFTADYLQVWGSDTDIEIEEGEIESLTKLHILPMWLNKE